MLIQEQSHSKLIEHLRDPTVFVVLTLSPQSIASIANMLGISLAATFQLIACILKAVGVKYVVDAASGGDVALVEAREEFMKRYVFRKPHYTQAELNLLHQISQRTNTGLDCSRIHNGGFINEGV